LGRNFPEEGAESGTQLRASPSLIFLRYRSQGGKGSKGKNGMRKKEGKTRERDGDEVGDHSFGTLNLTEKAGAKPWRKKLKSVENCPNKSGGE